MIIYIPFFLCWGSFLNVVAYRLIHNISIVTPRSFCPHCKTTIAWYDTIPLFSWLLLTGKCRSCKNNISPLYPFIEVATTVLFACLYSYIPHHYFFAYFIFTSALLVVIRSDIETMLISPYVTLFLAPFGFILSWFNLLPLSLIESVCGAICGYAFLCAINYVFKRIKQYDGIGEGDFDLLFLIGAFTGIVGCWASVTIGSALGSLFGLSSIAYSSYHKSLPSSPYSSKIPFGPFLALGAIIYIFVFFN